MVCGHSIPCTSNLDPVDGEGLCSLWLPFCTGDVYSMFYTACEVGQERSVVLWDKVYAGIVIACALYVAIVCIIVCIWCLFYVYMYIPHRFRAKWDWVH